jgi:hypothetical protein
VLHSNLICIGIYIGNLNVNLGITLYYISYCHIWVIHKKISGCYFTLSFIIVESGNLDTNLEDYYEQTFYQW